MLFSLLFILFFLLLGSFFPCQKSSYTSKITAVWQRHRGRKLSNSAPRRLFKNTFAETYFTKGSCSSTGRCSETFVQILSCGIPLSIYGTCIKSSGREPCWLQQAASAWICSFWPLEVVRERGKKYCFPPDNLLQHPRSGFSLGPFDLCPPELPQNSYAFLACT